MSEKCMAKLAETVDGIRLELQKEGAALELVCAGIDARLDGCSDLGGDSAMGVRKIIGDSQQHVLNLAVDLQDVVEYINKQTQP